MAVRKPISKKVRFEIFKRDKFTCQYCGKSAPDVILEVDHIKPVAEGGTNDFLNLITSCRDCNRGKGKAELLDDSVVKKQQDQLKELSEKKEQLEMMMKWREELLSLEDKKVDMFIDYVRDNLLKGFSLTDTGRKSAKKLFKKHSLNDVLDAFETAFDSYYKGDQSSLEEVFKKTGRILHYKDNPMSEEQRNIYYLRKILINRLYYVNQNQAYTIIKNAFENGSSFEEIKDICVKCKNWTEFMLWMKWLGEED